MNPSPETPGGASPLPLPSRIRPHYARFLGGDRILLSGHSHQAWPDVAREAQARYFDDAARLVDDKWGDAVLPKLGAVLSRIAVRFGFDAKDAMAFAPNTHDLVVRLLSSLEMPVAQRRVVTTDGEFHSLNRQLRRLEEAGWPVERVPSHPRDAFPARLEAALERPAALVACSTVFFEDAYIAHELPHLLARAADRGAIVLADGYHAFNAVPFSWGPVRDRIFAVAGGYKYAQFGEGLCFMRAPSECSLRPRITGWFADFGSLERGFEGLTQYASDGYRFAGSTFDASAAYRAEAVLDLFDELGLSVPVLRAISMRQTARIADHLDAEGFVPAVPEPERRGPFVAIRVPDAAGVAQRLRQQGVFVDARRDVVRLGPAPYVTDEELDAGVERFVVAARAAR